MLVLAHLTLKVPYYVRVTLPIFSNNKMRLWAVSELLKNEKNPSFTALFVQLYRICVLKQTNLEIVPF